MPHYVCGEPVPALFANLAGAAGGWSGVFETAARAIGYNVRQQPCYANLRQTGSQAGFRLRLTPTACFVHLSRDIVAHCGGNLMCVGHL